MRVSAALWPGEGLRIGPTEGPPCFHRLHRLDVALAFALVLPRVDEIHRTFDDLVAWIERGVRPDGEDVLAADLSRVGLKWTPYLHPEDPLAGRR